MCTQQVPNGYTILSGWADKNEQLGSQLFDIVSRIVAKKIASARRNTSWIGPRQGMQNGLD